MISQLCSELPERRHSQMERHGSYKWFIKKIKNKCKDKFSHINNAENIYITRSFIMKKIE